jgi:hypothetical protein
MTDIVFSAPDYATLLADAKTLGFTQTDDQGNVTIVTNGTFASGGGWFLNVVGTIYAPVTPPANPTDPWPAPVARAGYWGRLRLNGTPDAMPTFSSAITQYIYKSGDVNTPGEWVDAATGAAAPDYVPTVGVIA